MRHDGNIVKFSGESFLCKDRVKRDGWISEIPVSLCRQGGKLIARGLVKLF